MISKPVHPILKWEERNQQMVYDLTAIDSASRSSAFVHCARWPVASFHLPEGIFGSRPLQE
jgi:hypothetical protein